MTDKLTENILIGKKICKDDVQILLKAELDELLAAADKIKRCFCGNKVFLCAIINGKGGACSEDCKFCAQGTSCGTKAETFPFLDTDTILADCEKHTNAGIDRYSIVTAGRTLGSDIEKAATAYFEMHKKYPQIKLCGSHGLLSFDMLFKLKESGVTRYHCNIESSAAYFPNICTTHTFDDKLETIVNAKKAGLEICSGGIIGMGETMDDRIDMAFTLSELGVRSIPINILTPIKNTPLENAVPLSEEEILRTIAIFRFINPTAEIRLAAGRKNFSDNGLKAFFGGANAAITGDMLTTTGSTIAQDKKMLAENSFEF